MPRTNSTVKIVGGKVVFSQEIIDYFENIETKENSEWIKKYFNYFVPVLPKPFLFLLPKTSTVSNLILGIFFSILN